MRDRPFGPGSASLRLTEDPWDRFGKALALHLRRPRSYGAMEFTAPSESASSQARCTVQLAADSSHAWVTYRAAGHPLLEEMVAQAVPTDPGPIAEAVVSTCRDRLGVPHPHLLTVRCQGGVGQRMDGLGLVRTGRLPTGVDPADGADSVDVAVEVEGHEEARERFEALAEAVTGRPVIVDDNGDLVFDHVGHPVHVTFTENDPSARIWAWVARGVRSRSDTALRLSELNLDEQWTSWILDGRHVMQRSVVSVGPFLPRYVQFNLEHFLFTFATTRGGIAARLGPR